MAWYDDQTQLNNAGTWMGAGGWVAQALSQYQAGREAQKAANFQADQLRVNAGQAKASAQREAWSVQREADYVASKALAIAAASGGGASDPTVINLMARNAQEMAYRQQLALYEGDDQARAMRMKADATEYGGKLSRRQATESAMASGFGAGTSLLKGYARESSLRQRAGVTPPNAAGDY